MARLFEHQGKSLLKLHGLSIPRGRVASSPDEARAIAAELGGAVVLKSQVWTTKRAAFGGIRFAESPGEAHTHAADMLGAAIQNAPVEQVLVEEKLFITEEFFASVVIDSEERQPRILFSAEGGSGIEEAATADPNKISTSLIDVNRGLRPYQARELVGRVGLAGALRVRLGSALVGMYNLARAVEATSLEINPLVVTEDGKVVAADCRVAVDDYAVFRHPDLGIEIAREFNRPPTLLDQVAWVAERNDHRGTFFFMQLADGFAAGDGFVGFHGAGGGGSMMAMDALHRQGLKPANFTDTSGNPPASKVYRAAKIILQQKGLDGYFSSGSGVASQEQTNSSRGLAKAFREVDLDIPAVVRLGGNREDTAVELLQEYTRHLRAPVEGYKKDDTAEACAKRLATLIKERSSTNANARATQPADAAPQPRVDYSFGTLTGSVSFDYNRCHSCASKACITACEPTILELDGEVPVLAITTHAAARGGCTECLACELECATHGSGGAQVVLPIEGLDA